MPPTSGNTIQQDEIHNALAANRGRAFQLCASSYQPYIAKEGNAQVPSLQTEPANQTHDRQDLPIEFRVSRSGTPRRRLTLVGRQYTLGNGPDCSVRLDDTTLLPIHATIERRENGLLLRAMARPISVNGTSCTQHLLQIGDHFSLGNYDFELVPSVEAPQPAEVAQQQGEEQEQQQEQHSTTPRRRVSFAQSLEILNPASPTRTPVESLVHLSDEDPQRAPSVRESQRAILANEKRWQERWQRQQEKHRESQQRSKEQLESLRAAQSNADSRARHAEEMAQTLKQQLCELSNKWTLMTNSTVPDLQQQLERHQRENLASLAENQQVVDSVRHRLDSIQNAIDEVQAETQAIRQHSVFNEEQVRDLSEETEHLEKSLEILSETHKSFAGETKDTTSRLQQEIHDTSNKLVDVAQELEENRIHRDSLKSAIESLQTTLEQVQLDAQQSESIQISLAHLESQIESSESRFAELLSYFDSQNVHFQEECESLRHRLDLAEQLAGEASRVATELLCRSDSNRHSTASLPIPAKSDSHDESNCRPDSQVNSLLETPKIDKSKANPSSEYGSKPLEPSTPTEAISGPSESPSDDEPAADFQSHSKDNAEQTREFNEDSFRIATVSNSPAFNDSSEDSHHSSSQPVDGFGGSHASASESTSPSNSASPSHDLVAEQSNNEIPRFAATMPMPHDLAESISVGGSRFPGENLPSDARTLADGNESLESIENQSSMGNDNYQRSNPSSSPVAVVDRDELHSSADFSSPMNETFADGAVADDCGDESLYSHDILSSQPSYSGFAKLDPSIYEVEEDEDPDQRDITLSEDSNNDKPRYSPPKTRSAAEILAAMGIAVDEDDTLNHFEHPSNISSNNTAIASTGSNPSENSDSPHDLHQDSSSDALVDDEESIEDYMNRLLNRVQGTPLPQSSPSPSNSMTRTNLADSKHAITTVSADQDSGIETSQTAHLARTETTPSEVDETVQEPLDQPDSQAVSRRSPLEKTANIAALRELANTNARQAIASSARRRLAKEALFKLSIFGTGMIASLTTLAGSRFSLDHWMVISVCCFLLSLFFLWEALNLRKRLLTSHPLPEEIKEPTVNDAEPEA